MAALPPGHRGELSHHARWLYRTLHAAELAGLDPAEVIRTAIAARDLAGSRDIAAVLDARIRHRIDPLLPQRQGAWAGRVPRLPDPAWNAFWRIDPRPDGTPAPGGPLVNDVEDKLELIAAGQAVAIVSAGLKASRMHPDVTTVPLEGVEPSHVVLATRAGDRGRLVAAFRRCAQDYLTGK